MAYDRENTTSSFGCVAKTTANPENFGGQKCDFDCSSFINSDARGNESWNLSIVFTPSKCGPTTEDVLSRAVPSSINTND
ncbi:predicted protein [Botrytis cinerea T4]|uniref:Uncharacterized protein n=1 Tax=Botryotinia fuckeliana (strain T4) TaxID=999810 RepID=G2YM88_BOTF4|nr:predicted protein [Botrytis cinerea T4]